MFSHDTELQCEVEEPDPQVAEMLQAAVGGVEGELRVALQYNEVN